MQKFVKSHKYESITAAPSPIADSKNKESKMSTQVKLSGYLKKKRNKVGGWRKMWFVLQDKLLLSYASKEEYDNKLVSFKDVLNLVPGTIVRPLGGFRFTIETTSETMYTFRCDDSKICTKWITGLLDSLSNKNSNSKLKGRQIFHNISLENIRSPLVYGGLHAANAKRAIRFSYSCDSISRAASKAKNVPRIPIAHATARILERNGLSADDLQQLLRNKQTSDAQNASKDVNSTHVNGPINFRLHNNNNNNTGNNTTSPVASSQMHSTPFRHQLSTVTRINRMFERCNPDASSDSGSSTTTAERDTNSTIINKYNNNNDNINNNNSNKTNNNCIKTDGDDMTILSEKVKNPFEDHSNEKMLIGGNKITNGFKSYHDPETLESKISNGSCGEKNKERVTNTLLDEQQIYRISSLNGSHRLSLDKNSSERNNCLQLTTATVENRMQEELSSPVYAIINPPLYISSNSTSGVSSECKSDDRSDGVVGEQQHSMQQTEPIYAVIDLKSKHALRARKRNGKNDEQQRLMTNERNRPKSLHAIKNDYEEVLNLSEESLNSEHLNGDDLLNTRSRKDKGQDEDENIYEPINLPERKRVHRNAIWKYFSRLNIDALLEITRKRKPDNKTNINQTTPTKAAAAPIATTAPTTIDQSTTLSDIRRKLGNHRKSIKFRMKKLYARDHQPMPLHKHHRKAFSNDDLKVSNGLSSNNIEATTSSSTSTSSETFESSLKSNLDSMKPTTAALVMAEIEKYRRGKKPLFGSLSRLRTKTRTSLNFVAEENVAETQKQMSITAHQREI